MALSQEIQAMADIEDALSSLDEDTTGRVLAWAISRFAPDASQLQSELSQSTPQLPESMTSDSSQAVESLSLVELYDKSSPSTDAEKALVVAYWLQEHEGSEDVTSQQVNSELKHLGHGIGNVTRAFAALSKQRPTLAMQTRKSGSTKQARKKYRVTNEGVRYVENLMSDTD